MIIMLGGLHVEKALWYSVGDLLAFSGWTEALTEADVATSGTAESFLKASHITSTRHAYQVTALDFPNSNKMLLLYLIVRTLKHGI